MSIPFHPDTLDVQAREHLNAMHNSDSWEAIAQQLGYKNAGLVWRVAKGRKRAPNTLLDALGLETREYNYKRLRHPERDNTRLTLRLSPWLAARIAERAKATDTNQAHVARDILEREFGRVPRE